MHLRFHKSSIVVGLSISALLVLISIPGRVDDWSPGAFAKFEHGWPFVYLRRETVQSPFATTSFASRQEAQSRLPMFGIPWLSAANWKIWQAHYDDGIPRWDLSGRILIADCILSSLLLFTILAGYEFRRRRRKGPFSFSLGDIFVVVTAACAALGWMAHLKLGSERESALTASFDSEKGPFVDDIDCVAPVWMKGLIGERWMPSFTWRTASVSVYSFDVQNASQLCHVIRELPYLKKFRISGFLVGGDHFPFADLGSIRQLEILQIDTTPQFDDRDVRELSRLSGLKKIATHGMSVDRLLQLQSALPNCKIVDPDKDW